MVALDSHVMIYFFTPERWFNAMAINLPTTPDPNTGASNSKAVFNPSRDGTDNSIKRTMYGQVLRFPTLPPAHAIFEGVTVFDTETKDFYECQHIQTETEDYFEWVAVTFGAARAFLVPVGKLTERDVAWDWNQDEVEFYHFTDKSRIECIANTINEIINGLIRYNKKFLYLGYTNVPAGSTLAEGVEYYGYRTNDLIDLTGHELHKVYTGEVRKLLPSEYVIGSVVTDDYVYFTKADDPDMTDCVARMNEIIALLNKHFAKLPACDANEMNELEISEVLNMIVEEVNPFAVPWQVVIDRIWHLEQKVGNGTFVPNDDDDPVNFAGVWYLKSHNHQWLNVSPEIQDALKYATICQINDTIFKIISDMDGRIGDLITFLAEESVGQPSPFLTLVDYLRYVVAQIPELRRRLLLTIEGIRQLRNSLGNLGFIVINHVDSSKPDYEPEFLSTKEYFWWDNENAMMAKLVIGTDYNIGDSIADYCTEHEYTCLYTFVSEQTAENLIKVNAANIAENARNIAAINAILGTDLSDEFYIETLSLPVKNGVLTKKIFKVDVGTEEDYGANKDTTFTELAGIGDEPPDTYENLYHDNGPIFVLGSPTTVCEIVEMNNREIDALNRRLSARIQNIEENMNARPDALKELTGVEGVTADLETWHVDGYKRVVLPCSTREVYFEPFTKYYKKVVPTDVEYSTHFISAVKATMDKKFKANKQYYTPVRGSVEAPDYNEPISLRLMVVGEDYEVGDTVDPGEYGDSILEVQETYYTRLPALFIELKEGVDYSIPTYALTEDEVFDATKTYFTKNIAGVYSQAVMGTYQQYIRGECTYWAECCFPTKDETFKADKNYYTMISEDPEDYSLLTPGVDYAVGSTITGDIYEFGSQAVPANSFYEHVIPENAKINKYSNVWIRDRQWKEYNSHRGLIDRNTDDIAACMKNCGMFQLWTQGQLTAIKDFIMYMMLMTLEVITQENCTFSLLHTTTSKLVNILNALAKLEGVVTYKHADGTYDAAYEYYLATAFDFTRDTTFIPGKTYFIVDPETGLKKEAVVTKYEEIPPDTYFEPVGFRKMIADVDYEIGLEVSPRVYSIDLVMPTVENYTMTEIKDAINRVLRTYMTDTNLPTYTALPIDQPIQENIVYYRYVDDKWERIVPETDDPDMIGQLIKEYDPEHVWYIKLDEEIAADGYTMTWMRVILNEMIRLHNGKGGSFQGVFTNFIAQ